MPHWMGQVQSHWWSPETCSQQGAHWLPTGTRAELSMPSYFSRMYQLEKPPHFPRSWVREWESQKCHSPRSFLHQDGNIGGAFLWLLNYYVGQSWEPWAQALPHWLTFHACSLMTCLLQGKYHSVSYYSIIFRSCFFLCKMSFLDMVFPEAPPSYGIWKQLAVQ